MDVDIVKAALGCYFGIVRSVYIQSPQVVYVDIYPGNEFTSPGFRRFFFTGIHRASFPTHDCNVVFNLLVEMVRSDQLYTMAIAIANNQELSGMNLQYFHKNPEWKPSYMPKILDLPSADDLEDDIQQQL